MLPEEWEREIRHLCAEGQCLRAAETARAARTAHPGDLRIAVLSALVTARTGGEEAALTELERLSPDVVPAPAAIEEIVDRFAGRTLPPLPAGEAPPSQQIGEHRRLAVDVLADAADIFLEGWERDADPRHLRRARDLWLVHWDRSGNGGSLSSAARLTWLLGDPTGSRRMAETAVTRLGDSSAAPTTFESLAARALAQMILGQPEEALETLARLAYLGDHNHLPKALARRALAELAAHGLPVPPEAFARLTPPGMVVFAAPPWPAGAVPMLPDDDVVRSALRPVMNEWRPDIAYTGAMPGPDLLFVEAMLEQGGEVNLVLPFAIDEFVAAHVAPAGQVWETRFRSALARAASVTVASPDPYNADGLLFHLAGLITRGIVCARAAKLGARPYLILAGPTTADLDLTLAADWGCKARLRVLDLTLHPPPRPAPKAPQRTIRAMLFADIAGYGQLGDDQLPLFWDRMSAVVQDICGERNCPVLAESWGDAIYLVMQSAAAAADAAFALADAVPVLADPALPEGLALRIGLHAGPVFSGIHPLTGRPMVSGSAVTRTARIEPVVEPGRIYASEQFAAILAWETASDSTPGPYYCEHLGPLPLAKGCCVQSVCHLRRRSVAPALHPVDGSPGVDQVPTVLRPTRPG